MILQKILAEKSGWHMLVGCCLLNLTTREQVDKVWPQLFETFGDDPETFEESSRCHAMGIRSLIKPLGLQERRRAVLAKLTVSYLEELERNGFDEKGIDLDNVFGCGQYAKDSWQIFVLKQNLAYYSNDKVIRKYQEENTISDIP